MDVASYGFRLGPAVPIIVEVNVWLVSGDQEQRLRESLQLLPVCAGAGALAMGVPLVVIPVPMLAAAGLVLFAESGALRDYAIFVVASGLTACWFVHHHFWFLEVQH